MKRGGNNDRTGTKETARNRMKLDERDPRDAEIGT